MLSACYTGARTIDVRATRTPPPGPEEVQIRVAYTGICGTDLHIFHGAMDGRVTRPAVIGHEMSGTIAQVGADVTGRHVGEPVTVMPLAWDGDCPACRAGHEHICQNLDFVGIDSPGALQTHWNVRADLLVSLPSGLPLQHAALVEPVAVAVHDVRRSRLTAGDKAVVFGGGPIGVLISVVARHTGAEVLLVEPDPARRATAGALGFPTADPAAVDLVQQVDQWTDRAGADVVFEVSGAPKAVLAATGVARVRGTVVVVAIHPQPRKVDLQRVFWRELRLVGARVYQRADFERAVELLAGDVIPADGIISRVTPLTEVASAFTALESGEAMKVLVDCGGDVR
ncbi:alcohol dehydrogenase catalytic domain-containing protein [Streptomyces carpinensis]|uniref:2-deoxy-scyllo-inosamine dehydrogenase n=2 Tax=Streptomyces carpinensis TaxID=66369 RepID=A0ABV1VWM8_9ACTN